MLLLYSNGERSAGHCGEIPLTVNLSGYQHLVGLTCFQLGRSVGSSVSRDSLGHYLPLTCQIYCHAIVLSVGNSRPVQSELMILLVVVDGGDLGVNMNFGSLSSYHDCVREVVEPLSVDLGNDGYLVLLACGQRSEYEAR